MIKRRSLLPLLQTLVFLEGIIVFALVMQHAAPRLEGASYRTETGEETPFTLPLRIPSDGPHLTISLDAATPIPRGIRFLVHVDDCLTAISVNEQWLRDERLPFCGEPGRRIDLGPLLRSGRNRLVFELQDHGGLAVFQLRVSLLSPVPLLAGGGVLLLTLWYAMACGFHLRRRSAYVLLLPISAAGAILRILYMFATPIIERTHDWNRHIEYITFLRGHFSLPPTSAGLEFYQPPLYYLLAALWMEAGGVFRRAENLLLLDLQRGSLFLSLTALGIAAWIARMLFPQKQRRGSALFLSLLATLPGLVFLSSVINNDTLAATLSFLALALLLRWWQTAKTATWSLLSVVLGLGLLTKGSIAPLIMVAWLCALLRPSLSWKAKAVTLLYSLAIIALLAGWFLVLRFPDRQISLFGNTALLNPALRVENSALMLLTFDPIQILQHTYNDPLVAEERNGYFWEYLFRSAFFGEYRFDPAFDTLSFLILLFALLSVPTMLLGIWKEITERRSRSLPMLLAFLLLLLSLLSTRILFPYSVAQDFRYIPLIAVPAAWFAVRGSMLSPFPLFRRFSESWLWGLVFCCGLFLVRLVMRGG